MPESTLDSIITSHLNAWNSPAGDDRDRAISDLYTSDVVVAEPETTYSGHAGMAEAIAGIQAAIPGAQITRSGPIQSAQELTTYSWALGPAGGPVIVTGRDVLIIREGKISALYVIIDAPAE